MPGTAPLATPPYSGPPGPGWRWQARPWTGTMVPLDGEDFAPHLVALIISHVADRHGSAQQEQCVGGEGRATPGGGGGGGACAGMGGIAMRPPPRVLVAVRQFLQMGCRSFIGNDRQQTNDNQKLTKGGF
jgi:hypothetical protein